MGADPKTELQDAQPKAWQGDNKPDLTEPEIRIGTAARRFAAAAVVVESWDGPRSGPDYQSRVATWRERYADLITIAKQFPSEEA